LTIPSDAENGHQLNAPVGNGVFHCDYGLETSEGARTLQMLLPGPALLAIFLARSGLLQGSGHRKMLFAGRVHKRLEFEDE